MYAHPTPARIQAFAMPWVPIRIFVNLVAEATHAKMVDRALMLVIRLYAPAKLATYRQTLGVTSKNAWTIHA
jgi:hypothetical protein